MKLTLAYLASTAAIGINGMPPVISLDFETSAMKIYPYSKGKYGKGHPVKGFTPHSKEVPASNTLHSTFGVCTAGDPENKRLCKLPNAHAYDHHEGSLVVTQTTHLVNLKAKQK